MNIAPWLLQDWEMNWGIKQTELILEQFMKEPYTDLSVKLPFCMDSKQRQLVLEDLCFQLEHGWGKSEDTNKYDEFVENDGPTDGNQTVILPHGMIRTKNIGGAIPSWPLYNEGVWWIQDASAALPAIALCNGLLQTQKTRDSNRINNEEDIQSNAKYLSQLHVVDMCSAPGGKCAQLLSAGMHVTAIESSARRSKRLIGNLDRLGFPKDQCTVVVSKGQDWFPSAVNDCESINLKDTVANEINGVLVDVPCSATGTASRRPDVLRKDAIVLKDLLKTQETLTYHCADNLLKKGGVMVYATCSLLKRESEEQVQKLIARGQQEAGNSLEEKKKEKVAVMKTLPFIPGEMPGFDEAIDENGWLRILPGVLGGELKSCDGFFVARLVKCD